MKVLSFMRIYKGPLIFFLILVVGFSLWYFFYNMQIKKETDNFKIRSTYKDRKILDELSKYFDESYRSITHNLNIKLDEKITIRIYPSLHKYKRGVRNCTWSDTWIKFSSAQFKDIRMLSPNNEEIEHITKEKMIKNELHSLVHVIILNSNRNMKNMPMWLTEGIAEYEINKGDKEYIDNVAVIIQKNEIPDFNILKIKHDKSNLRNIGSTPFNNVNGEKYSYTIIDFIVSKYGQEKLNEIIKDKNYKEYLTILGFNSEDEFITNWNQFLNTKYN